MLQYKAVTVIVVLLLLLVSPFFLRSVKTSESRATEDDMKEKWEYLVVAAPSRTNFQPTGNPRMRKLEMGGFGVEAFVLEQHMDKVGADGWELVSVTGTPADPILYFKRLKPTRN